MGFTLIAYAQSITSTAMANITAAADPHVRVNGADILVPTGLTQLLAVYAGGVDIAQAQVASPSIRRRYPFDVRPIDRSATPTAPSTLLDYISSPIDLDPAEQINFLAANQAAPANVVRGALWLGDGKYDQPAGDAFTIRLTGTTTLVANAWTNCAMTLSNQLPFGDYIVVGARFESATGVVARLVLPNQYSRPGAPCVANGIIVEHPAFRQSGITRLGEWGRFNSVTPPTVDFLAGAADTAQTVHLDLIKVGA